MSLSTGQTQIIPNIVQNKVTGTQQGNTLTVAVTSGAPTNIVGANLIPQIHRQTSVSSAGILMFLRFHLFVFFYFKFDSYLLISGVLLETNSVTGAW